jgi:hypothetical protein
MTKEQAMEMAIEQSATLHEEVVVYGNLRTGVHNVTTRVGFTAMGIDQNPDVRAFYLVRATAL